MGAAACRLLRCSVPLYVLVYAEYVPCVNIIYRMAIDIILEILQYWISFIRYVVFILIAIHPILANFFLNSNKRATIQKGPSR